MTPLLQHVIILLLLSISAAAASQCSDSFTAIDEGDIDWLRDNLDSQIINSCTSWWGESLLHRAASKGQREIAIELIDKGINVNKLDWAGGTALLHACSRRPFVETNADIVDALLDAGADPDIQGEVSGFQVP